MMRLFLVIACLFAAPAFASPVVADLSQYRIAIDSTFSGIRLFLFGARNGNGDVIVVVRGPAKNYIVRRKERVAGMWINRDQATFRGTPGFYAISATHPLEDTAYAEVLKPLGIGFSSALPQPGGKHTPQENVDFSAALLDYQKAHSLYQDVLPLTFMGETLFKTVIPFPDTIPRGMYTAEIYLISDGTLVGMQALPIKVEKTGFDAAVYDFAHVHPLRYAAIAITMAIVAGWGADKVFRRRPRGAPRGTV